MDSNTEWFFSFVFKDQEFVNEYQIQLEAKSDKKEEAISEFSDGLDDIFLGDYFQ